jgi:hypothetical protein
MSANAWIICPECKHVDSEYELTDQDAGTCRVDHEFYTNPASLEFRFRVSFDCMECGWSKEITPENIDLNSSSFDRVYR